MELEILRNERFGNEVYWASTKEYEVIINDMKYDVRVAEDSNGMEILILLDEGWTDMWSWDQDAYNEFEEQLTDI